MADMYVSKIVCPDIANGIGCRCTIFVSGCRHHCKGCFNKDTWNFKYGKKFTKSHFNELVNNLRSEYIRGVTFLGGEPFEPENQPIIYQLTNQIKKLFPTKDIWAYTGCTWEELLDKNCNYHTKYTESILKYVDILVDGRFVESLKDVSLKFRGSSNQRIIKSSISMVNKELILSELN